MGIHTGEKRHECPWKDCTREFTYIVNLEQHFKVHTDMLPFKCPWEDCNREFLEFSSFRLHAKYHTRIIPRILKSKPIIIQNHTGKQPFLCTWKDCGKAFTRKYYLKIHKCIHTGERPYKCFWKDCDKVFTHSEQRIRHIKVHNDDKPFRCPWEDCRDEFVGIKHFQVHVSQVHTLSTPLQSNEINEEYDDEKITLQCNNDSSLHSSSNSHQHINSSIVAVEKLKRKSEDEKVLETEVKDFDDMHENAEKFYAYNDDVTEVDDMDGDGQFGVDQLNEHRSNIDGTESHGDQLGRNMPSAQVVEPDKSQTGKHLCVNCGKGFKQRSDLTRHFRKHTGDRPYECPHCGRSFAQNNDLKKHILIHTGERPHACEQCRKAFRSKSNLIRHWNVHKRNPVEVNEGAP